MNMSSRPTVLLSPVPMFTRYIPEAAAVAPPVAAFPAKAAPALETRISEAFMVRAVCAVSPSAEATNGPYITMVLVLCFRNPFKAIYIAPHCL